MLSPSEDPHRAKKANMSNLENITESAEAKKEELKDIIGQLITEVTRPLVAKMKLLRESIDNKYNKLEDAISSQYQEIVEEIHKLEVSLTNQKEKANTELLSRNNSNQQMIENILQRNKSLEKENTTLKERLDKIEMDQLSNNVIITGVAEQAWETYEH